MEVYHANGTIATDRVRSRMTAPVTDSAYVVLTLIALRGPSTAYDVKRGLEYLAQEFWSVPHTQVYRECSRLAEAGLLDERQEGEGRRRRVYSLTEAGREEVTRWVRTPTADSIQVRDIANVKLLASELSTPADVRALAEAQAADYRRRLQLLDDVEQRYADRPELASRMRSIRMGRAVYEAARDFWADVAEHPDRP